MKKLIKLDFNNTTRERKTEDSFSELYSYDKNNGSFEFEILNDTLTTEQVTALFKFTDSNKIWKTTGTVEGNKVKVTFDTTLITQNETVICYLYFDEEQRTSDAFRFKFKVKVSEIDKMNRYEVKERFINNTVIVDRLNVVTKTELQEALKNVGGITTEGLLTEVKAEELYAKKSDIPQPYDDIPLIERVAALENRPSTGGGNVDVNDFVTRDYLDEYFNTRNSSSAIVQADKDIETYFIEESDIKDEEKISYRGYLYSYNGETKIFKQKNGDDLEFVGFQGAMITLANVLPKDYDHYEFNDPEKRVTLLTDRNFKEMVATPEFKAVVKESLRDIVKEIIKEEN